jgi:hypothetical protein
MSYSVSTLLTCNLRDVFGENDPSRRRAAIDEIWSEDGVFYDPKTGVYRGRDEIDRVAGAIRVTHPDFRYRPIAEPEELGNGGRVQWVAAVLVRRRRTPGPISSLSGTVGSPPFISFSTIYPELLFRPTCALVRSFTEFIIKHPNAERRDSYFKTLEFELLLQSEKLRMVMARKCSASDPRS